jgi:hypothetical protein
MSLSEEQKRLKREEYLRRWNEACDAFEKEKLPLDELTDFYIQHIAKMAHEDLYTPEEFDSRLLLDGILNIRSVLDQFLAVYDPVDLKESEKPELIPRKSLVDSVRDLSVDTRDILSFLSEVHRIVTVQVRSGIGHDANDIKQELYSLFPSPKGSHSEAYRREERIQIMVRLVALHIPNEDWTTRKKWAQANFGARNIWSIKRQGAEWKVLKSYWLDFGDAWEDPIVGWESKEREIDELWSWLTVEQRGDRRRNT